MTPSGCSWRSRRLRHRGPDHAAHRAFTTPDGRHVALLHTRLSIIDLDARSNQPFRVGHALAGLQRRALQLPRAARAAARARGAAFQTESDTEVLARRSTRRGWEALDSLRGHVGVRRLRRGRRHADAVPRPLRREAAVPATATATALYFGSEVKSLRLCSARALPLNLRPPAPLPRQRLQGALQDAARPSSRASTSSPPARSCTSARRGSEHARRYWTPRDPAARRRTWATTRRSAGTRERLIRVGRAAPARRRPARLLHERRRRLRVADLRSRGACFGYDVHGFTIVNSDERYEEQDMVEHAVVRARRPAHRRSRSTPPTSCPRLRALVRQHDAPVYTITYYVHWLLMEAIHAHGYRVSVSGTAADELFSGYYDHHLAYLREVRADPALHAPRRPAWREHVQPLVRNPYLRDPDLFVARPGLPRPHLPRRRGVRRASCTESPCARAVQRAALHRRPAAQPDAQRAVPRGGPGDPPRGRPQRDVLLDREPLAVPRPRAVRVRAHDPDRAPRPRRARQGGAARGDARDRARRGPRQPPQGRLQRAAAATCSTVATPPCAPSCSPTARSGRW